MSDTFRSLLQSYSKGGTPIFLKEGEYLVRQNDSAEAVFVIVSGRMHAVLESETGPDQVVAEIGAGETVGEMSLITGRVRSTSVVAARDSELRRISKEEFEKILLENPRFLLELTREIALRLDKTTRTRKIVFKPKNIVFIPAGSESEAFNEYIELIAELLSRQSKVVVLDDEAIHRALTQFGLSTDDEENLDQNSEWVNWLNNIEDQNDFVICATKAKLNWWSKRCLRSADRIFLLADANGDSNLNEIEIYLKENPRLVSKRNAEFILQYSHGQRNAPTSLWLSKREVTQNHHVERGNRTHMERQIRFLLGKPIGLVLGGGGAKGLAHIGVIRAMNELGMPIDMIGGTSAGSIVAGLHALGMTTDEQIDAFKRFVKNYNLRKYTFPWLSLFSISGIESAYREFFGDHRIEDLFTHFFCISCNLNSAQRVVHVTGLLRDAIRASTSIPGIYEPVLLEHNLLIDGGIMDNVPAQEMRTRGANTVIAVDVASRSDLNVAASLERLPTGWQMLMRRIGRREKMQKIPNVIEILMRTLLLNSINRSSETSAVASVSLRPPVEKISMLDFSNPEAAEKIGYEYAKPLLEMYLKSDAGTAAF